MEARRGSGPFLKRVTCPDKVQAAIPPPEPLLLAQGEARLHAAWARMASHWATVAVSHQEDDMTDTKLLRHSLDSAAPLKPHGRPGCRAAATTPGSRPPAHADPRPSLSSPQLTRATWLSCPPYDS